MPVMGVQYKVPVLGVGGVSLSCIYGTRSSPIGKRPALGPCNHCAIPCSIHCHLQTRILILHQYMKTPCTTAGTPLLRQVYENGFHGINAAQDGAPTLSGCRVFGNGKAGPFLVLPLVPRRCGPPGMAPA